MKISRRSFLKTGSAYAIAAIPTSLAVAESLGEPSASVSNSEIRRDLRNGLLAKSRLLNSANPTVTFLGDSNSHGVGSVDIYRNSYVNVIKRLMNYDHKSYNYGFAPMMSTGTDKYFSQDIHEVSFFALGGKKNSWKSCEGDSGAHVPQGLSFVSLEAGNLIATTIPTFQRRVKIWYVSNSDGGSFVVKVNGKAVTVVNTQCSVPDPFAYVTIDIYDGHYEGEGLPFPTLAPGLCRVECVTESEKKVELCGFSYVSNDNSLTVNNFSNSGRRLRWIDEAAIKSIASATDVLIVALSYNDAFDNANDTYYFMEYKRRIDWIIKYAKEYSVSVFVADFVWDEVASNNTRIELKRLASEADGVYIPFPEIFSPDGVNPSWRYRMNEVKTFFEPAHLNIYGHECVAEIFGYYMGLGSASKEFALSNCDWWYPINLLDTGVGNSGSNSDSVCAVRSISKGVAALRLGVTGITSEIKRDVCQKWPSRSGISGAGMSIIPLEPRLDGTTQGVLEVSSSGHITAIPSSMNANSTHKIFATFPTT